MSWTTAAAVLLTPFVLAILSLVILNPAKRAIMRRMPEGRIKRLLLFRVN